MIDRIIQWAIRTLGGVSRAQWDAALKFVLAQSAKYLTGEQKKAEAIALLEKIGIKGSAANWLVEAAVMWLKRIGQIS